MVDVIVDWVYRFKIKFVRIAPMGAAETAWRFVVQRRVRSLVIVLFAPFLQILARLTHTLELDSTQYLVAHRPVEAFYLPVLRRLPWTRKLERYSPCFAPLLHSYKIRGGGSSDFGLYQFFELMSRSIVMSSIWSATMRFNCAFSRSSSRSLCMLFESIPPYLAFQR